MKTTISAKELRYLDACEPSYTIFVNYHGKATVNFSQCLDSNSEGDVYWLLDKITNHLSDSQINDLRRLACDFALTNVDKIKPYCTDNDYQTILDYLNNPNGSAAESAARSLARALAWSAESSAARSAFGAAEWLAAWSAARSVSRQKLKDLLLKWEDTSS